jgi:hypothetical protein
MLYVTITPCDEFASFKMEFNLSEIEALQKVLCPEDAEVISI